MNNILSVLDTYYEVSVLCSWYVG